MSQSSDIAPDMTIPMDGLVDGLVNNASSASAPTSQLPAQGAVLTHPIPHALVDRAMSDVLVIIHSAIYARHKFPPLLSYETKFYRMMLVEYNREIRKDIEYLPTVIYDYWFDPMTIDLLLIKLDPYLLDTRESIGLSKGGVGEYMIEPDIRSTSKTGFQEVVYREIVYSVNGKKLKYEDTWVQGASPDFGPYGAMVSKPGMDKEHGGYRSPFLTPLYDVNPFTHYLDPKKSGITGSKRKRPGVGSNGRADKAYGFLTESMSCALCCKSSSSACCVSCSASSSSSGS